MIFLEGGGVARIVSSLAPIFLFRPFLFWRAAASKADPLTVRSDALDAARIFKKFKI